MRETAALAALLMLVQAQAPAPPRVEIAPGQTWQLVVNAAPPGSTFLIKAGVHRMQTLAPRTGDIYLAEKAGDIPLAIASGARVLTAWTKTGTAWVVTGQTQEGRELPDPDACRPTHPRCNKPEDLFFDNVLMKHVATRAEVGPGTWWFDYPGNRIFVGDDPAGHVVETSVTPQLIVPGSTADNVTIDGLIIEKYAAPTGDAAANLGNDLTGADGWVIRNCIVRWNHGAGIWLSTRTSALNNEVQYNGGFGFVGAGEDIRVEGNQIAFNNIAAGSTKPFGYNPYWGAGGSKWVWTTNLTVVANRSHHNDGPGLWTDINNIYTRYEANVVEDNTRGGIFHEISYDARIVNNWVRRNGTAKEYPYWTTNAGIEIVSSRNVEVTGNTVEDNWQGITGLDDHRGAGIHGPWTLTNLYVYGNTVTNTTPPAPGSGRSGVLDTQGRGPYASAANNRFQWNRYIGPSTFLWMLKELTAAEWRSYGHDTAPAEE